MGPADTTREIAMHRRLTGIAIAAAIALAVAGCTIGPDEATPSDTPAPASPTPEALGCVLTAERYPGDDFRLGRMVNVELANVGDRPCVMQGFPTARYLDAQGQVVDNGPPEELDASNWYATFVNAEVTVEPGGKAYAFVAFNGVIFTTNGYVGDDPCDTSRITVLEFSPPGADQTFELDIADKQACAGEVLGHLILTPVRSDPLLSGDIFTS